MRVTVKSILIDPLAGLIEIEIEDSSLVSTLIEEFCRRKFTQTTEDLVLYTTYHQPLVPNATLENQGIIDGSTVYLGLRREADDITVTMKWKVVIGVVLFLGCFGIIIACLLYSVFGEKIPFDYGIVLDAGSTHTQVTVYKWEGDKDHGTGKVTQEKTCKVKGGIQDNQNFLIAGETLLPCLNNVSESIPQAQHSTTPLFLGATAGMRLLRLSNQLLADAILMAIRCTLAKTDFSIKTVDVISGKNEGLFAWITGNILENKLDIEEKLPINTYGALDLGGASTQISFEIDPGKVIDNSSIVSLKLYGNKYTVFSRSYLCFGINEASRRYHALLVGDPKGNKTVFYDPCGLHNYSINYTADFLFNQPCTKTKQNKKWLLDEDNLNKTFTFIGAANNTGCSERIESLMSTSDCKKNYSFCFEVPQQPLTDTKYMAVSTYYYVAEFLNVTDSTLEEFEKAMHSFCNTSYEIAEKSADSEARYVGSYCFEAHYVYYILTEGYGFNSTLWKNVQFINKVGDNDVGWSLGFMINDTNIIPEEKPKPYISVGTFVILLVLCIILIISGLILLVKVYSRNHQSEYVHFS